MKTTSYEQKIVFGLDYDWVDGLKIPDEKEFYE